MLSQKSQKTVEVRLNTELKTIPSQSLCDPPQPPRHPFPSIRETLGPPSPLHPCGPEPSTGLHRPDLGDCGLAPVLPSSLFRGAELQPRDQTEGPGAVSCRSSTQLDSGISPPQNCRTESVHTCPSKLDSFLQSLLLQTKTVSPVKS